MKPFLALLTMYSAMCYSAEGASNSMSYSLKVTSRQRLEEAAVAFSTTQSTEELTDAVLAISHHLRIPDFAKSLLKSRLAMAERAYWKGEHPGVAEADIVAISNDLVSRLALPRFAYTNLDQIQMLHMQSIVGLPRFMGHNATRPAMSKGDYINYQLSPLQASHLLLTLFDQKFYNPRFQVTPEEWPDAKLKILADISGLKANALAGKPKSHSVTAMPMEQFDELSKALNTSLDSLDDISAAQLLTQISNKFGI